jgi:hypothetical protein
LGGPFQIGEIGLLGSVRATEQCLQHELQVPQTLDVLFDPATSEDRILCQLLDATDGALEPGIYHFEPFVGARPRKGDLDPIHGAYPGERVSRSPFRLDISCDALIVILGLIEFLLPFLALKAVAIVVSLQPAHYASDGFQVRPSAQIEQRHAAQLSKWPLVFMAKQAELERNIGQLTMENDFLRKRYSI